jgi:hypothetical protein
MEAAGSFRGDISEVWSLMRRRWDDSEVRREHGHQVDVEVGAYSKNR